MLRLGPGALTREESPAMPTALAPKSSRFRWLLLVQGLAALDLGIFVFVWPGATLGVLLLLFGACLLLFCTVAIVGAITTRRPHRVS